MKLIEVTNKLVHDYIQVTPKRLKIIDAYLLYVLLTGVVQFLYCCMVGTFPFNSFLSGFISCVGCFILAGKNFSNCRSVVVLTATLFQPVCVSK